MEKINDGGSAFARPIGSSAGRVNDSQSGMSLRDYFAAKALAAMIMQPGKDPENCGKKAVPRLAEFAYEYADAMIKARSV